MNFHGVSSNSAHGPACDGQLVPHIVAPGCNTDSTVAANDAAYSSSFCGTSMASPVASGGASFDVALEVGSIPGFTDPVTLAFSP